MFESTLFPNDLRQTCESPTKVCRGSDLFVSEFFQGHEASCKIRGDFVMGGWDIISKEAAERSGNIAAHPGDIAAD